MYGVSQNKKITSQKILQGKQSERHHQQLVFRHSKIIFYDDQFINDLKNIKNKVEKKNSILSINYNLNKLGQTSLEKFKNKHSRLQNVMSAKSKFREKKTNNNANGHKKGQEDKQNIQINLIPITSDHKQEKKSSLIYPKSASRLSNCMTKPRTSRIVQANNVNPSVANLLSPRTASQNQQTRTSKLFPVTKSPQKNQKKYRRQSSINSMSKSHQKSHLNTNSSIKNKTKTKSKTCIKQLKQSQNMNFNQNENSLQTQRFQHQSCYQNVENFGHQDIKKLFGGYHAMFKAHRDYLIERFSNIQSGIKKIKKNSLKKIETEKRLQQQLQMLNSIHASPKTLNNPKMEQSLQPLTFSTFSPKQNQSLMLAHSLERAPILQYLKNSETKKLLTLMIQPSLVQNQQNKYIDKQFPYQKVQKINQQDIHWIYIEPNCELKMFGDLQEINQDQQIYEKKQLKIVGFLKCIYEGQPQIIKRLFQPVFANVFSVWLFVQGVFQPVFIDGYFPLDAKLNHIYGGSTSEFWIPVLIKCICKVKNTFQWQTLQKISAEQVYRMLTGTSLHRIPQQKFIHSPPCQVSQLLCTHLSQNSLCIAEYQSSHYSIIQQSQSHLYSYHPSTNSLKPLNTFKRHKLQLFIIPSIVNYFVYSFLVRQRSLSKLEIYCACNMEIVFAAQRKQENYEGNCGRRVYIYESVGIKSSGKVKLVLRYEGQISDTFKCKLRRGNYKIFIEDGQKNIHNLFSEDKVIKWQQKYDKNTQFRLSLLTTHQIKLSEIEVLQKKGCHIQDSQNIYENPKQSKPIGE